MRLKNLQKEEQELELERENDYVLIIYRNLYEEGKAQIRKKKKNLLINQGLVLTSKYKPELILEQIPES